jgi:hypothetical protein
LRISLSKKKFDLINVLVKHNDDLSKLVQASESLAPSRHLRKTKPTSAILRKIQDHASSLHAALNGAWICSCQDKHPVKLRLETRISRGSMTEDHLKILFARERSGAGRILWKETEVRVVEHSSSNPTTAVSSGDKLHESLSKLKIGVELVQAQVKSPTMVLNTISSTTGILAASGRGRPPYCVSTEYVSHVLVKFIWISSVTNTESSRNANVLFSRAMTKHRKKKVSFKSDSPTPSQPLPPPHTEPRESNIRIQDICSTINSIKDDTDCMGFLLDQKQRRHMINPLQKQELFSSSTESVTLQSLLLRPHQTRPSMNRRNRFTLAIILASSLLQLHSTPWMSDGWNKQDVFFLSTLDLHQPIISRPYLFKSFHSSQDASVNPSLPIKFNTKTALTNLGIMLLELCFNIPIESHPSRSKYFGPNNKPNAFTDISTAREWHEDVLGELGDDMSDAIRRCLDCSFGPKPNLAEKDFQEAVWEGVMIPLQTLVGVWEHR